MLVLRVAAAALALTALSGCSTGRSCTGLDELDRERDSARADFAELAERRTAGEVVTAAEIEAGHDRMHEAEQRREELAQACDRPV